MTYKGNTKADISVTLGEYVETGLDASKGASMTLVDENELAIALNTASGVELYSYDLTTNTAAKMCDVTGAQTLIALNLMSDIAPGADCQHTETNVEGAVEATCSEPGHTGKNMDWICYSTPISEAKEYMDPEAVSSPVSYPSDEILANGSSYAFLPEEISRYVEGLFMQVRNK